MRDGLWAVLTDRFVAGFVVEDGRMVRCAPILRRRIDHWVTMARWVCP